MTTPAAADVSPPPEAATPGEPATAEPAIAAPNDRVATTDRANPPAAMATQSPPPPPPALAPAVEKDYNRTHVDFRAPMPRPKVKGTVIDAHCHLFSARHAATWFEAADHYGIDKFVTMTPLEDALALHRDWPTRVQFIAVP